MLRIQREKFSDILDELKVLLPEHYEELALNKDKVPLSPQYDEYIRIEEQGSLLLITVREENSLVGYYLGFVSPGLHYSTCLTLMTDIYYVVQDERAKHIGKELFDTVEKLAKSLGVQRWFVCSKAHKSASKFLDLLGFDLVETQHSKWLGE